LYSHILIYFLKESCDSPLPDPLPPTLCLRVSGDSHYTNHDTLTTISNKTTVIPNNNLMTLFNDQLIALHTIIIIQSKRAE